LAQATGAVFAGLSAERESVGMTTIRRSADRGQADHGWLDSRHTFSFADYHDPAHMGFRTLRVINQDIVAPGGGFPTHPHRDMEIFSYVLEGALQHRDSLGNGRVLKPGDIQLMGAGTGVQHSEFNPSPSDRAHFLQIWIRPRAHGLAPSYTEWHPDPAQATADKVLVISQDGREQSAVIRQDADIYRLRPVTGGESIHVLRPGRGLWLQVIRGPIWLDGVELSDGDGASVEAAGEHRIRGESGTEGLLFDLR